MMDKPRSKEYYYFGVTTCVNTCVSMKCKLNEILNSTRLIQKKILSPALLEKPGSMCAERCSRVV